MWKLSNNSILKFKKQQWNEDNEKYSFTSLESKCCETNFFDESFGWTSSLLLKLSSFDNDKASSFKSIDMAKILGKDCRRTNWWTGYFSAERCISGTSVKVRPTEINLRGTFHNLLQGTLNGFCWRTPNACFLECWETNDLDCQNKTNKKIIVIKTWATEVID